MYQVNIFIPCVLATRPLFGEGGFGCDASEPKCRSRPCIRPQPCGAPGAGWVALVRDAHSKYLGCSRRWRGFAGPNALRTQVQLVGAAQLSATLGTRPQVPISVPVTKKNSLGQPLPTVPVGTACTGQARPASQRHAAAAAAPARLVGDAQRATTVLGNLSFTFRVILASQKAYT